MPPRTGGGLAAAGLVLLLAACSNGATAPATSQSGTSTPAAGAPTAWKTTAAPVGATLTYLSCATVGHCVAASGGSGTIEVSTTFGRTWTSHQLPHGVVVVNAISCGDATHCVIVGVMQPAGLQGDEMPDFVVTSDGGTSWKGVAAPKGVVGLDSVSCATGTDCVAIGTLRGAKATPEAFSTTDAGATWSLASSSLGAGEALVSCQSATSCWLANGGYSDTGPLRVEMRHSSNLGRTWTTPGRAISPMEAVAGLACPTAAECVVVGSTISNVEPSAGDGDAWATGNAGETWARGTVPGSVNDILGVACAGAQDCWAVGRAGDAPSSQATILSTTDGGGRWVQDRPEPAPDLSAIDCFAPSDCIAVGPVDIATLGNPG